ncbi:type IV pilin protein [Microbulbifer hydrolyticus]|uniref:Prepilin-type N-terminal cleavage/methylation domain-containing protein n=1 Tax=Microbulbifer hydrolyticus TaxID=48074 RepID=A0A6P1T8Y8_9GAMM|nr:type IV pilin protein [Microbulbifer hydrolyticus]MBB5210911.1 type IV pilus assembly protein PilE [Microbulbifer hydrolyticus]QHQ38271.1 prepilin-type N-terminal cleavage/methylation domain-containing protein [Microbulbifer hydrolyticus]
MKSQKGFTLIELMIVVAIIGIIAGIAYPSYMESVRKSNRADAKASLNDVAQRLQRCYTVYNKYDNFVDCSVAKTLENGTIASGEQMYSISAATLSATVFALEAAPVNGTTQASDAKCGTLKLSSTGVKDASGPLGASCW